MDNLMIIGTSHIARQSVQEITQAFERFQPDIVALELDSGRFHALFSRKKAGVSLRDIRHIGVKGFLFAWLGGWLQKKLGRIVGAEPGIEMKHAASLAHQHNVRIALIDQEIGTTLHRFSQALGWWERGRIVKDVLLGLLFPRWGMGQYGLAQVDLHTVPPKQQIKKMLALFRQRYPNMYKVLVTERNVFMAARVKALLGQYPDKKLLVIIGAGHEEGMKKLLKV